MSKIKQQPKKNPSPPRGKAKLAEPKESRPWLWPVIIFFISFIVYSNTLSHGYALDDDIYCLKNKYSQQGLSAIKDLFNKGSLHGFDGSNMSQYRPIPLLNFTIEIALFGNNHKIHHFFNIVLFGMLCVLIFFLTKKLLKGFNQTVPVLITLLFALHPIHTEVVANIKSRDELLCTFFALLAISKTIDYYYHNKRNDIIFASVFYFLSALCKENGLVYIGIIPFALYFFTDAPVKRIVNICIPIGIAALVNVLLRSSVLDAVVYDKQIVVMNNALMAATNKADQLATNFVMLLKYIGLLIFPHPLSWDYSFNEIPIVSWSNIKAIGGLLTYLGLGVFTIISIKKRNMLGFTFIFFITTLILSSNLIIKIESTFSERFLFAPSFGFCMALPLLAFKAFKIDPKAVKLNNANLLLGIFSIIFLLYALKTYDRNKAWANNYTLFSAGLNATPGSARVHYGMANEFRVKAEAERNPTVKNEWAQKAIYEYKEGIKIYPYDAQIWYNMGVMYYGINDMDNALKTYDKTLEINPKYVEAINNKAVIYFSRKNFDEALRLFAQCIQLSPNYADAYANIGACYHNKGMYTEALSNYEKALQLNPKNKGTIDNIIKLYSNMGNTEKVKYYQQLMQQ